MGQLHQAWQGFGWQPAGTLAPAENTHWGKTEGLTAVWDGNYSSKDRQEVACDDAKAMSAALQTATLTWDRVEDLTIQEFDALRRVPRAFESYVTRVARYSAIGGFFIY